jgi:phosphonate degradation associated HDIG domain protein
MDLIDDIEALFDRHGASLYEGRRREPVTALQHALQCAQLAEWAQAGNSLVAAALLHDIGHFIEAPFLSDALDDVHEMRAVPFLSQAFGPAVVEPVRLHVQAKRYLVATDLQYLGNLTPASVHSLHLQGGPMCRDEVLLFEDLPYAVEAVALRRWDDLAKKPRGKTPTLAHYLSMLRDLVQGPSRLPRRALVGALGS